MYIFLISAFSEAMTKWQTGVKHKNVNDFSRLVVRRYSLQANDMSRHDIQMTIEYHYPAITLSLMP